MTSTAQSILAAISELEVIDAHEHLWPEEYHLQHEQDVLTLIQYSLADIEVAGASPAEVALLRAHRDGPQASLEERWAIFRKFLPYIKDTAPIRALFIALREFYGCEELSDATYEGVSAQIRAARKPGIYEDILRRRCKISAVLNQNPQVTRSDGFLLPIRNLVDLGDLVTRQGLEALGERTGGQIRQLDDLLAAMRAVFDAWEADGTVAVKRAGSPLTNPTREEAGAALTSVLEAGECTQERLAVQHFVENEFIAEAGRRGWPVCVHTGLWAGTWADIRGAHPEHMIEVALRHRDTRFDVYHAGVPWVSTVGVVARMSPNLWVNLCWTHVISPVMARRALDEWLDVVPINKIIGWGGDYWMALEKVYGHLVMARENIAEVLGGRVERGLMSEARAIECAQRMLADNPRELYGIG